MSKRGQELRQAVLRAQAAVQVLEQLTSSAEAACGASPLPNAALPQPPAVTSAVAELKRCGDALEAALMQVSECFTRTLADSYLL